MESHTAANYFMYKCICFWLIEKKNGFDESLRLLCLAKLSDEYE